MLEKISFFCNKHKHIYLYGAGMYALHIFELLKRNSLRIDGCIVSDKKKESLEDVLVIELKDIKYHKDNCGVILALSEKHHKKIIDVLIKENFKNYISFSDIEMKKIRDEVDQFSMDLLDRYDVNSSKKIDNYENILLIRLDGIGDMVLTGPFIKGLRYNHRKAHITLITSLVSFNLYEFCPYVDDVIVFDWQKYKKYALRRRLELIYDCVKRKLPKHYYDIAIVPRWDVDYYGASFIAYFSGARRRVAYSEKVNNNKAIKNKNYNQLFTEICVYNTLKHELLRNMDLLYWMDGERGSADLELWDTDDDRRKIDNILDELSCYGKKIVLVGISASETKKKWDYRNYLEVIKYFQGKEVKFILIGGQEDVEVAVYISQKSEAVNLVGMLTLREIVALSRHAVMYVGNDTGVMHIAAACGVKVLEISGSSINDCENINARFYPWGVKCEVLQPNRGEGINSISIESCIWKWNVLSNNSD